MRKNFFITILFLVIISLGTLVVIRQNKVIAPIILDKTKINLEHINTLPLFATGLSSVGIKANDLGFHDFSSNGKYFLFNTLQESSTPANQSYVMNTQTGEITNLPGMPERGFSDSELLQLYSQKGMIIYNLETKEEKKYTIGENIFWGSLSPNHKLYLVNSTEGIKKIDLATDTVSGFSTSAYDGAYAWFSDSKHILGFKETGENLFEAGKGRTLGVWNVQDGTFKPLPVSLVIDEKEQKSIKYIQWIVQDKIARVNTGWDDGSFDFLVDVENNTVVTIGDTSQSLMGGIVADKERGLFAVVGKIKKEKPTALMYKGLDVVSEKELDAKYFRESAAVVDEYRLLYIRKEYGQTGIGPQSLVLLSLDTGEEKEIQKLPSGYSDLSLAPDHKHWVVSVGTTFYTGTL